MRRFGVVAAAFAIAGFATLAHAQFDFNPAIFGTSVSIQLSPSYPAPNDLVFLSLNASGIDLSRSSVTWTVDGKTTKGASAQVRAGGLGSAADVVVAVETADGIRYEASATVAPTAIELLTMSDSYAPPFYRGRPLPSAGTSLVVAARAHFVRADGSSVPDTDIVYTWRHNGDALGSLSGRGRSAIVIPIMHLYGPDVIEVEAVSSDGTRSGSAAVSVPLAEPRLALYQDHPLYGILYNSALLPSARITDSEMGFTAVPYFASAASPSDSALSYEWRVNGSPVATSASSKNGITINADNSTGRALIELDVTHRSNFYMDARGEWDITLSSGAGGSSRDPFSAGQ